MQLQGIAKVESINLLLGLLGFSLCPGKSEVPGQGIGLFSCRRGSGKLQDHCLIILALEDRDKAVSLVAGSGDVLTPLWCHESTLFLLAGCARHIFWHFPSSLVSAGREAPLLHGPPTSSRWRARAISCLTRIGRARVLPARRLHSACACTHRNTLLALA